VAVLTLAGALSGCGSIDWDAGGWFRKPADFLGREGGYTYTELQETTKQRPVTANDLVQQNGACPAPPAAVQQAPPNPAASNPGAAPPVANVADGLLGGGVALGMSECEVVYRAGQPSSVQLGQNPNGDRTAVLTFDGGPRAGIYHFERGRLTEMDDVAQPPAPPEAAKKKPKAKKPVKSNNAA